MKPVIGLTMGDPAGIGPEILLRLIGDRAISSKAQFVLFGSRVVFQSLCARYKWNSVHAEIVFIETSPWLKKAPRLGVASAAGGKSAGEALRVAVQWASVGGVDAIVTAPINKEAFKKGGWGKRYPGHTEMLAALTGARDSALMMVYENMRVVHVTSHIPLREVAARVTTKSVYKTILLTQSALEQMGVPRPRIGVCGLNPHAGDNGVLGTEDARVIEPAVKRAKRDGVRVSGPMSADALWPLVWGKQFDVGVAMYHDQGQIPMKLLAFKSDPRTGELEPRGVNVTVGLPIVRTSVAHGTAYEMAGKKRASAASLIDAVTLAVRLARVRKR